MSQQLLVPCKWDAFLLFFPSFFSFLFLSFLLFLLETQGRRGDQPWQGTANLLKRLFAVSEKLFLLSWKLERWMPNDFLVLMISGSHWLWDAESQWVNSLDNVCVTGSPHQSFRTFFPNFTCINCFSLCRMHWILGCLNLLSHLYVFITKYYPSDSVKFLNQEWETLLKRCTNKNTCPCSFCWHLSVSRCEDCKGLICIE